MAANFVVSHHLDRLFNVEDSKDLFAHYESTPAECKALIEKVWHSIATEQVVTELQKIGI